MVWLTAPTPSVLSEWVQARERDPSMELALVRDAVLERASRVILADGTGRGGGWGGRREGPCYHCDRQTKSINIENMC